MITLNVITATGKRVPKHPYFFIHEYKKELESSSDPLGQLMIAMVAAQHLNQDGNPLYGAYVVGRSWNFVILDGKEYKAGLTQAPPQSPRKRGEVRKLSDKRSPRLRGDKGG